MADRPNDLFGRRLDSSGQQFGNLPERGITAAFQVGQQVKESDGKAEILNNRTGRPARP